MKISIRDATIADVEEMVELLSEDAAKREASDPMLWKMAKDAEQKLRSTLTATLESERPPFRQQWLLAETDARIVGIAHTILLPVPPIYAGEFGPPGLIMENCHVVDDAPSNTTQMLLEAAEADLIAAGAKILLGSSVAGRIWEGILARNDYDPLTLYLAKTDLRSPDRLVGVRSALPEDVTGIVASSEENRRIVFELDDFWKPHPEAAERFGAWMTKSLSLSDRDMFIAASDGGVSGYAISQPATPLHFPTPHDIGAIGVVDDYYHSDLADPTALRGRGTGATALLFAAEAALEARGNEAALIVCPAAWASKISVLKAAGYDTAITWYKKR